MRKFFDTHKPYLAAGLVGALFLALAVLGGLWASNYSASAQTTSVVLVHVNPDGSVYTGNPFCPDTLWVAGKPSVNLWHDCNNITSQNHLIATAGFDRATMTIVKFNLTGVGEIVGSAQGTRCGDLTEAVNRPNWDPAANDEQCLVIHSSDPGESRITLTYQELMTPTPTPTVTATPTPTVTPTVTPTATPTAAFWTITTDPALVKEWDSLVDTVILKKGDLESVTVTVPLFPLGPFTIAGTKKMDLPKDMNGDGKRNQADEHLLDKQGKWQDHGVMMDEATKRIRSGAPVQLIEVVHGEHNVLIDNATITVHQPTEGAVVLATIEGHCTFFTDPTGTYNFGQRMNGITNMEGRFVGPTLAPAITSPGGLSIWPFTNLGPFPNGSPTARDVFYDTLVLDATPLTDIYVDTVCEEQAKIVIKVGYPDMPGSLRVPPPDEWVGINWTTVEVAKQPQIRWAGEEIVLAKRWALAGDFYPNINATTKLPDVPCPLVTAYDYDGDGDVGLDDYEALGLVQYELINGVLTPTVLLSHYVQYNRLDPSPGGLLGGYEDDDYDGTVESLYPHETDHATADVDSSCVSKALYSSEGPGQADVEAVLMEEVRVCSTGWEELEGSSPYCPGGPSQYEEHLINKHAFLVWYLKIFQVKLTNVDGARADHNAGAWKSGSGADTVADTLNVSADTLLRVKVTGWFYSDDRSSRPDTCIDVDGDGNGLTGTDATTPGEPYAATTHTGCTDLDDEMLAGGFWVLPDDLPRLAGADAATTRTSWDVMQSPAGTTADSLGLVGPKSSLDSHDAVGRPWIPCLPGTCPRKTVAPDGAVDVSDAIMPPLKIRAKILDPKDGVDNDGDTVVDGDAGFLKEANKKVDVYTEGTNLYYRIMVPADPEIPPFVNNGGTDWDSWYSRIEDGNVKSPSDQDNDGVPDSEDNCRVKANPNQYDQDGDCPLRPFGSDPLCGDACDDDIDGDGTLNTSDRCQYDPTITTDTDSDNDGAGDSCDDAPNDPTIKDQDADLDDVKDSTDNCPSVFNPDQTDTDKDGAGDACDDTIYSGGPFTKVIAPLYVDPNPTGLAQGPYEFWHILNKKAVQYESNEYPYYIEFYTDNRGEGMFFANGDYNLSFEGCLRQQLSGTPDCKPGDVVGTTSIQVIGDYPYFRKHTTVQSNPVEKTWTWGGFKSVTAERIDATHTAIIAHLKDRDGYCKFSVGTDPTKAGSVVFSPSLNEVQHEWIEFLLNTDVGFIRAVSPNALYEGDVSDQHSRIDLGMSLAEVLKIQDHVHRPLAEERATGLEPDMGLAFHAERAALARAEDIRVLNFYGKGRAVDEKYTDPTAADECQAWVIIEHPADQEPNVSVVFHDPEGQIDRHWPESQFVSVLVQGWNDSCYTGPKLTIEKALTDGGLIESDGTSHVLAAYRFTNDENQAFDRWFPNRPDVSTITDLQPYDQLFLLLDSPRSWTMSIVADQTAKKDVQVSLIEKWNSVCYAGTDKAPDQATASINGSLTIMYTLATDQTWRRYVPNRADITNIVTLNQFTSVFVQMTNAGIWVFDP